MNKIKNIKMIAALRRINRMKVISIYMLTAWVATFLVQMAYHLPWWITVFYMFMPTSAVSVALHSCFHKKLRLFREAIDKTN